MKMYLLSDNNDTLMGMRMAGVDGKVLTDENQLRTKLSELIKDEDLAVIMITENLFKLARDTINELKLNLKQPLIIEIPDRHGQGRTKDAITKYVKDAIGVNLS